MGKIAEGLATDSVRTVSDYGKMNMADRNERECIEELAYRIYLEEGRPTGCAEEHWIRAEKAFSILKLSNPPSQSASELHSARTTHQGK